MCCMLLNKHYYSDQKSYYEIQKWTLYCTIPVTYALNAISISRMVIHKIWIRQFIVGVQDLCI